ncbi:IS66 family transposase zinc-finger binding domain-containing protein [Maridesulfovibrio bastinii]|uniref:IS66 family transposase zinc-finger binding domain-containing protein n=1 Tax=Maridesulfovibrio bastinii TaxID=47157 RepID=UPI001FE1F7BD|nr:IS66 family transposase zinc-finger binding domain-containing protein [Maridesulfovibrio bastinii]
MGEIIHDTPDEEKIYACGCKLSRIGEVVSEKLDYVPTKIRVLWHIRPNFACKKRKRTEDDGQDFTIASMPPQLIRQGIVTPRLLAHILTTSFATVCLSTVKTGCSSVWELIFRAQPFRIGPCWRQNDVSLSWNCCTSICVLEKSLPK